MMESRLKERKGPGWVVPVHMAAPSLSDNTADADRLIQALSAQFSKRLHVTVSPGLLEQLSAKLRGWNYAARCVLFEKDGCMEVLEVLEPSGSERALGFAVDLGTTRIVMRLVDLERGTVLGEIPMDNPQASIGADILTRIHHAESGQGRYTLQSMVARSLEDGMEALCAQAGLHPHDVFLVAVSGNTTMTHLLMGLPCSHLIREPYIPVVNTPGVQRAGRYLNGMHRDARIFFFPNIGSYFGGDLISGILYAGIHRQSETTLLVDVGTNAEVVLGNQEWLLGCAGAAGPALEGGVSSMGMTAGPGVIDRVWRDGDDFFVGTIEDLPPVGICGSGFIDLAAALFLTGMMDPKGKLVKQTCGRRYVLEHGLPALVVVPASESGTGEDIVVSQPSLDSLVRSKAAMYTILETLAMKVGAQLQDVEKIYVAGTFGAYIDPESAVTIGMIPDLPLSRYEKIGNSSLEGATQLLLSQRAMEEVRAIRNSITYVELNVDHDFMIRFSGSKFIPHTDPDLFPSVKKL